MAFGKRPDIEMLTSVPLFAACTRQELKKIASLAERMDVGEGTALTTEGAIEHEFYVIADGTAKVSIQGRKRGSLGPGDFFGELALLDPGPRAATVTAEGPMTVYQLGSDEFRRLLIEVPYLTRNILRGVAHRMKEMSKRPVL